MITTDNLIFVEKEDKNLTIIIDFNPIFYQQIEWIDHNITLVIGNNDLQKLFFTNELIKQLIFNGYCCIKYHDMLAQDELKYLLDLTSNKELQLLLKMLISFFPEFKNEINFWKENLKDLKLDDMTLIKYTIKNSGSGYQKLATMILKGIKFPIADYYFLINPESSIHPIYQTRLINFLTDCFEDFKFIIVTDSLKIIHNIQNYHEENRYYKIIKFNR